MSLNARWIAVPRHRRILLATAIAVCLLGLGARVSGQARTFVSLTQDESCPLTLSQVQKEPRPQSLDLTITGVIGNPGRRTARSLVVTAAIVDDSGRVTNLHFQPLDLIIERGGKQSFRIVFEKFPADGRDRVVFGIQAVRWSRTEEWRGVLKVVSAPAVLANNRAVR